MWYDRSGLLAPVTQEIASVPMDTDPFRLNLGETWLSSVEDPNLLKLWFPDTLSTLLSMGFVQRVFLAKHWHDLPNETVFDLTTATEVTP